MLSSAQYSGLERSIHNLAFGSSILQEILSDIESSLYSKQWHDAKIHKPIFITSLPRAGTTIILEALHRLPNLATHTYRDMPFILTPVLWARVARRFQSQSSPEQERAHADGLAVNEDSPEAFEEVLWLKYFADKYSGESISLWESADIKSSFAKYFREHIKKIIFLRRPEELNRARYVSKNNTNICRIQAINKIFPDAYIIVPLRDPIEHAVSLQRQHKNFCERHAAEPFVRKYMEDIGHFEFGHLHRPIQFPGLSQKSVGFNLDSIDYWVSYWVAAFGYLSQQAGIDFISYEPLCEASVSGLKKLCQHLELEAADTDISEAASIFRPAPPSRKFEYTVNPALMDSAITLHEQLSRRCVLKK